MRVDRSAQATRRTSSSGRGRNIQPTGRNRCLERIASCGMCHEALEFGAVNHSQSLMFPNGGDMKTKTILLTLALYFVAAAVFFASDVQVGNWKLNEGKSKLAPGGPKNRTVVTEATGATVKATVE